jgi:hypothetical protein
MHAGVCSTLQDVGADAASAFMASRAVEEMLRMPSFPTAGMA